MKQTSLEESLWSDEGLEHRSNLNLIYYYHDELLRVYGGENSLKVFGEGLHSNFTRQGILVIRHSKGGRETVISPMWLPYILDDKKDDR